MVKSLFVQRDLPFFFAGIVRSDDLDELAGDRLSVVGRNDPVKGFAPCAAAR
jgi:hypothetical protein